MAIARYYVSEKNENEAASFPGVPLRDVTDEEWDSYPTWLQRSVDESDLYRKTKPAPATKAPARKDDE